MSRTALESSSLLAVLKPTAVWCASARLLSCSSPIYFCRGISKHHSTRCARSVADKTGMQVCLLKRNGFCSRFVFELHIAHQRHVLGSVRCHAQASRDQGPVGVPVAPATDKASQAAIKYTRNGSLDYSRLWDLLLQHRPQSQAPSRHLPNSKTPHATCLSRPQARPSPRRARSSPLPA